MWRTSYSFIRRRAEPRKRIMQTRCKGFHYGWPPSESVSLRTPVLPICSCMLLEAYSTSLSLSKWTHTVYRLLHMGYSFLYPSLPFPSPCCLCTHQHVVNSQTSHCLFFQQLSVETTPTVFRFFFQVCLTNCVVGDLLLADGGSCSAALAFFLPLADLKCLYFI